MRPFTCRAASTCGRCPASEITVLSPPKTTSDVARGGLMRSSAPQMTRRGMPLRHLQRCLLHLGFAGQQAFGNAAQRVAGAVRDSCCSTREATCLHELRPQTRRCSSAVSVFEARHVGKAVRKSRSMPRPSPAGARGDGHNTRRAGAAPAPWRWLPPSEWPADAPARCRCASSASATSSASASGLPSPNSEASESPWPGRSSPWTRAPSVPADCPPTTGGQSRSRGSARDPAPRRPAS